MSKHIQFGGSITKADLERYSLSPQWKNGSFQNTEETIATPGLYKIPGMIYKQFKSRKDRMPPRSIEVKPFNSEQLLAGGNAAKFIWYGHSALMMRAAGKTLLIDPMLGPDCSPIGPVRTRRFTGSLLPLTDQFPAIDIMLLSHDHYDHLDYESICKLMPATGEYWVALGVKRHLLRWGVPAEKITEFDWWDQKSSGDLTVHFTPTRHFSGRGLSDRAKSLWGGWAIITPGEKIWFSGDSGYGRHFAEIGAALGPFDLAFMECGQYCPDWPLIHMFPEESVQAALDAGVKKAVPVHWGGFNLSYHHTWYQPVEHFTEAAKKKGLSTITPEPGAVFTADAAGTANWWETYKKQTQSS